MHYIHLLWWVWLAILAISVFCLMYIGFRQFAKNDEENDDANPPAKLPESHFATMGKALGSAAIMLISLVLFLTSL